MWPHVAAWAWWRHRHQTRTQDPAPVLQPSPVVYRDCRDAVSRILGDATADNRSPQWCAEHRILSEDELPGEQFGDGRGLQ